MIKRKPNTWYVSIHLPEDQKTGHYSRRSEGFASEAEAKKYAAGQISVGTKISAGTLNPVTPKRVIDPSQIHEWLSEMTKPDGN